MVICELCGSANKDSDESCRVCGQALKPVAQVQAPVAVSTAQEAAVSTWPTQSLRADAPSGPVDHMQSPGLQMSAVKQAPQTGVPPMIGDRQELEPVPGGPETTSVPGFMNSSRTTTPQPEPVQLISANDLPDWIKQIAAEDEAKAAAEAEAALEVVDPTDTIVRRQLPGETHVGGPSTTWLSKSGTTPESGENWGTAEVASANWGGPESVEQQAYAAVNQVAAAAPVFIPSTSDAYSSPTPKKRLSISSGSKPSSSSPTPVYRKRSTQLLALLMLLMLLAIVVL